MTSARPYGGVVDGAVRLTTRPGRCSWAGDRSIGPDQSDYWHGWPCAVKRGQTHLALAERVLAEDPAGTVEPLTRGAVAWTTPSTHQPSRSGPLGLGRVRLPFYDRRRGRATCKPGAWGFPANLAGARLHV